MILWLSLIIPLAATCFLYFRYKRKMHPAELVAPILFSAFLILIIQTVSENLRTVDEEYLTSYLKGVRYYEDWNERVSCRHPIYCESCSGSGKNRHCDEYVCGHEHMYDVDYHPAEWLGYDNTGISYYISEKDYKYWSDLWGNSHFQELNRHFHTNDGDLWFSLFDNKDEHMRVMSRSHTYSNRVAVASSIFKFQEVTQAERSQYKLFDYPEIRDYNQRHILGVDDPQAERALSVLNARLGSTKQVKVFFLIYIGADISSSVMQEALWKGGNKNELILTIGTDQDRRVTWTRGFSWTDHMAAVTEAESLAEAQIGKSLDLTSLVAGLQPIIQSKYVRKEFKDFDYLSIPPTLGAVILTVILLILGNIAVGWFCVNNDLE